MNRKLLLRLTALLLTLAMTLCALLSCASGADDEETPPDQMQCASIAGAYYRLYVPTDWNLMTSAGISGAYYSMDDSSTITAVSYPNEEGLSTTDFWNAQLDNFADVFEGEISYSDLQDTLLGSETNAVAASAVSYIGTMAQVEYTALSVLCSHKGEMLVLTYIAPTELYETYLSIMEVVVQNFRFSDKPYTPEEPMNTVDTSAEAPAGMKLASNDDVAYRFYVPESWVINPYLPTSSAYVSETDKSNVSVTVYMPEQDTLSAEQYWDMCLEALQGDEIMGYEGALTAMTQLSDTVTELDGRPAHTYVYEGTVAGVRYRFSQTIAAYRGMVYTLTYTATVESFDNHTQEVQQMIEAFDFRGN